MLELLVVLFLLLFLWLFQLNDLSHCLSNEPIFNQSWFPFGHLCLFWFLQWFPITRKDNQPVFPKCIVIVVLVSGYVYLLIETLDYHIAITYDILHIVSQINCELNVNQIPLSIWTITISESSLLSSLTLKLLFDRVYYHLKPILHLRRGGRDQFFNLMRICHIRY